MHTFFAILSEFLPASILEVIIHRINYLYLFNIQLKSEVLDDFDLDGALGIVDKYIFLDLKSLLSVKTIKVLCFGVVMVPHG